MLKFYQIWQAPQQHNCRDARKISKWLDDSKLPISLGFEISRLTAKVNRGLSPSRVGLISSALTVLGQTIYPNGHFIHTNINTNKSAVKSHHHLASIRLDGKLIIFDGAWDGLDNFGESHICHRISRRFQHEKRSEWHFEFCFHLLYWFLILWHRETLITHRGVIQKLSYTMRGSISQHLNRRNIARPVIYVLTVQHVRSTPQRLGQNTIST